MSNIKAGQYEYLVSHPDHNNLFYVEAYTTEEAREIVWQDTANPENGLSEEEFNQIEIVKTISTREVI